MTNLVFTLLQRRTWIDRRLRELDRNSSASISRLRLKAMRLAIERRLKSALAGRQNSLGPV